MKSIDLDGFTGFMAIGSLVVAGFAVAAHAFVDVRAVVADLADQRVWDVLIAVPLVVLSYAAGLVTVRFGASWFDRRRREGPRLRAAQAVAVGSSRNELAVAQYTRAVRELELLQGGVLATAVLALGLGLKIARAFLSGGERAAMFLPLEAALIAVVPALGVLIGRNHEWIQALVVETAVRAERPDAPDSRDARPDQP